MNVQVVVVKIGGSLFTQPSFVSRLRAWTNLAIAQFSPAHVVFITGGGPLVEGLRKVNGVNTICAEHAHWVAVHLMDVNASLLNKWWPELHSVRSLLALRERITTSGMTIFHIEQFLHEEEPASDGTRLPIGWDVSSDSIAARVALILSAGRLFLLKSVPGLPGKNWSKVAAEGLVDQFFPHLADQIAEVRILSLDGDIDFPIKSYIEAT